MKRRKILILSLIVMFVATFSETLYAQRRVKYDKIPKDLLETLYAKPTDTEWFKDAKFGVFVHWGPYSLAEVPASWGRNGKRPGAGKQAKKGVPAKVYDALYKKFNPTSFDADEWVKMIKKSGAKYFIFTTKHHDGFCMFDANNTNYKITNTPFRRDVCKEIADACHKYGIKLFWYYSQPDWHHPDCLGEHNERYRKYMYQHLKQLLTKYGKISGLFFDGLGTKYYDWDTPRMVQMIRKLQPGIIINRRWGSALPGKLINGDYDNPEQQFGMFERERPWEMCATISEAWSWTGAKKPKTFYTNFNIFILTVGSGGNLALNTGPTPLGEITPAAQQVYSKMGEWLDCYGKSVYNTLAGPYKPGAWGVSTCTKKTIYLHLTAKTLDKAKARIELSALNAKVNEVKLLTQGTVDFDRIGDKWIFRLSNLAPSVDQIIKIVTNQEIADLPVVETLHSSKKIKIVEAKASSEKSKRNSVQLLIGKGKKVFAEGKKHKLWWSPQKQDTKRSLTFSFGSNKKIESILIAEQIRNCSVRRFALDYKKGNQWVEFYQGSEIGMNFNLLTEGLETSAVRLRVLQTVDNELPSIGKIAFYSK